MHPFVSVRGLILAGSASLILVEADSATRRLTVTLKDSNGAAICSQTLEAES
jgi:hypothetical protein